MRTLKSLFLALLMAQPLQSVTAAEYPERPIRVLIGFPAGGSADIVARIVTDAIAQTSKYEFVVENKTGAGGNLAFEAAASAAPDGYTLLFSTPGIAINPSLYSRVNYEIEDFTPVTLVGESPLVFMVRPSLGIDSVDGLLKKAAEDPQAIRFASSGNGSSSHLAAEVFKNMSSMQYLHVPYRGGGAAVTDLIGDRVDMTVLPIAESMPYVQDKKLVALGQTGSKRSSIAPDIPTISESGVKGYSVTTWYMLLGPKNLPQDISEKLYAEFSRVVQSPELKEKLVSRGVDVINADPSQTRAFLAEQSDSWAKTISKIGIKLN